MEQPPEPRPLPAQRVAKGIEEYVEGVLEKNDLGEYFVARQAFPFGRPYGKLRIGDISAADLSPLNLLFPQPPCPRRSGWSTSTRKPRAWRAAPAPARS